MVRSNEAKLLTSVHLVDEEDNASLRLLALVEHRLDALLCVVKGAGSARYLGSRTNVVV